MDKYADWIAHYVFSQNNFVRGKCKEASIKMLTAFPELRLAGGFVRCSWGRDQHWWCVAPDGRVVDATVSQFHGPVVYDELDLRDPSVHTRIPTGRCANCGGDAYEYASFCSDRCADEVTAELNRELHA